MLVVEPERQEAEEDGAHHADLEVPQGVLRSCAEEGEKQGHGDCHPP